jgi:hypothetical protein
MTAFGRFQPETIRILREVHVNNRKDWFDVYPIGWGARCRGGEEGALAMENDSRKAVIGRSRRTVSPRSFDLTQGCRGLQDG